MVIEEIYAAYINNKRIKKPKNIEVETNETVDQIDISINKNKKINIKITRFLDENDNIFAEIIFHQFQKNDDNNIRIIGLQRDELTDEISALDFEYMARGRLIFYD